MTPEQIANLREIHAQAVTNRGGDFEVECDEAARLAFMADAPRLLDIAERFARLQPAAEAACDAYGKTGGRIIPTMESLAKALETP